jgi:Aldehyde dehydrogenase family
MRHSVTPADRCGGRVLAMELPDKLAGPLGRRRPVRRLFDYPEGVRGNAGRFRAARPGIRRCRFAAWRIEPRIRQAVRHGRCPYEAGHHGTRRSCARDYVRRYRSGEQRRGHRRSPNRGTPGRCVSRRRASSWRMRSTTGLPTPPPRRLRPSRSAMAWIQTTRWDRWPTIAASPRWKMLVADSKANGARVTAGGSRIGNRGYFFPLTVLADVPDDARAMREEPFGPLALLSRVRNVIEKANSVPYGLAAYAFANSARNVDRRIGWPRASRSAISRSTNLWHRAPKPRSAASRTAASRGKAAPRDYSATPW